MAALEERVGRDLTYLNYPPPNSNVETLGPDGLRASDAVVVGAGLCGIAAGFALLRYGIGNIRILDRSEAGLEGPWLTTARMKTLRTQKELTGLAAGIPSLTYRAWFEARYGADAWKDLVLIERVSWMEYLTWFRRILKLPVENNAEVTRIVPDSGLLRVELRDGSTAFARKVVLATGIDGLGGPRIPDVVGSAPRQKWAHSSDAIDFCAHHGRRIVVVGGGASAMDCAAASLEHGAESVRVLLRRPTFPRANKLRGLRGSGFTFGYRWLDDATRWELRHTAWIAQSPPPRDSVIRVARNPRAMLHFNAEITAVRGCDKLLHIETAAGRSYEADFLILATGFQVSSHLRPELSELYRDIETWADHYVPPSHLANDELGGYPYLASSFAFRERRPGAAPWLANVHCFNDAATLSMGKVSGDIGRINEGAAWLAESICSELFRHDFARHWALARYEEVQELDGSEWVDADRA